MALSRSHIGRIKIEERIRHVPAFDDPEGIAAPDLNLLEPEGVITIEGGSFVSQLLAITTEMTSACRYYFRL
jgi:hypothetical protein